MRGLLVLLTLTLVVAFSSVPFLAAVAFFGEAGSVTVNAETGFLDLLVASTAFLTATLGLAVAGVFVALGFALGVVFLVVAMMSSGEESA